MTQTHLPHLAELVLNRPLFLHPAKAETILNILEGRIGAGPPPDANGAEPDTSLFVGSQRRNDGSVRSYSRASEKTAIITIDGSLVNRGAWINANSGLVSYEGISAQLGEIEKEAKTGSLQNLVIDMNSFGGEASGMFVLAEKLRSMRKFMHIVAVVNDVAASAGYGIISAADEVVISPTSLLGSIGVVMVHLDRSDEMKIKGIRPTLIHAGAKKVDGNPFGPLPDDVRADMTRDVMAFYDSFLETVAKGRGNRLTSEQARATEAGVKRGQDAIDIGFADRIGSLESVLDELSRPVRAKPTKTKGIKMNSSTQDVAAIVQNERSRISSIMNSDAGKARPKAALLLALSSDSPSAETAIGLLGTMPDESTAMSGQHSAGFLPLEQRASAGDEIGASGDLYPSAISPETIKAGWKKAFSKSQSRLAAS